MRFAWLVARRYLRSPYKPAVLRLVTMFSVIGIAAGVATLVIALAMNTGFRRTIQDRLLGVSAHVNLTRPGARRHRRLSRARRAAESCRRRAQRGAGNLLDGAAFRQRPRARRGH